MSNYYTHTREYLYLCKKRKRLKKELKYIDTIPSKQRDALKMLKNKKKLRCVFLALFEDTWKCDKVYQLMNNNKRFEPIILSYFLFNTSCTFVESTLLGTVIGIPD